MHAYIRVYIHKYMSVRMGLRVCVKEEKANGVWSDRYYNMSYIYHTYILMIACLTVN